MALTPAKCPNCGGTIKIDASKKAGICEFCKQPFVVEDAINNYNTYNQQTYNIENADLHLNDERSIEKKLESAEVFLTKFKDYEKAFGLYKEVTEIAAGNWQGWWGLCRVTSHEFTRYPWDPLETQDPRGQSPYLSSLEYVKRAYAVAPVEKQGEIQQIWRDYNKRIKEFIETFESKIPEMKKIDARIAKLEKERQDASGRVTADRSHFDWLPFTISVGVIGVLLSLWWVKIIGGPDTDLFWLVERTGWVFLIISAVILLHGIISRTTYRKASKIVAHNYKKIDELKSSYPVSWRDMERVQSWKGWIEDIE